MPFEFAARMQQARPSFVREILKVTDRPGMISFAGGLPNPRLFPVAGLAAASRAVMDRDGRAALQYRTTEGYPPLREWIARQYQSQGLDVTADHVLITTGSQQALDLLGKVMLDPGDEVIVERPTYIAAIQAFGMYGPTFHSVPLDDHGIDLAALSSIPLGRAKVVYCMPNFQNPTGLSYSFDRRRALADTLRNTDALLIEDDPYGLLRFRHAPLPPLATFLPARTAILGTFSKTIAPGLRIGWVCAPRELIDKLVIAKQAADLHSDHLSQRIVHEYLTTHDFPAHLETIRSAYRDQCDHMLASIDRHFPKSVRTTRPDGGMFLWATLPPGHSATALFHRAIEHNVAFVPGVAFHAAADDDRSLRLNFSNSDPAQIDAGIERLAVAMNEVMFTSPRRNGA